MSENNRQQGKREARGGWWSRYRAWAAGLDRRTKLRLRLCQALAVLVILIVGVTLFLRSWIRLPSVPEPPGIVVPPPGGSASQPLEPGQTGDVSFEGAQLPEVIRSGRKEGCYTFLLVGRDVISGATDTMMLITYDTAEKRINAISLLRDTMVNTSAKRGAQKRLNVVFARNMGDRKLSEKERIENGMTALKKEVSRLTGVYPDFYVMVEWEAIGRLVDAVGGVEFEVPFDMDYDDPYQDLHIHQKKGFRLLSGQDAMEVIRFRKSADGSVKLGDAGRTQIQRDFLTATLKKCLTPEILLKLPTLADIFMDNVNTDLAVGNILAFAQLAVGMDVENEVTFVSMPYNNVSYDKAALVCAREKELLELLNDGINPYLDEIKSSDLQLMYRKPGGGFGVTNAALADPAVANVPAPKPAEPDGPEAITPEDPDTEDPGTADGSGTAAGTGGAGEPGDIGDIDPGDIFPDIPGGENEDEDQAAA